MLIIDNFNGNYRLVKYLSNFERVVEWWEVRMRSHEYCKSESHAPFLLVASGKAEKQRGGGEKGERGREFDFYLWAREE